MVKTAPRIIIYAMLALMQIGLFTPAGAAAAPVNTASTRIIQLDAHGRDPDRQREHDRRKREEEERHKREMQRRPNEGEKAWRERQKREKERHNQSLREIAAFLVGAAIGSAR